MSERRDFVHEVTVLKRSMAATCRKYDISRKTGYKWLARFEAGGQEELSDRSRRPRKSPGKTPAAFEEEVLKVRDQFGWGAPKIWSYLRNDAETNKRVGSPPAELPTERTIGNVLRRHGRIATTSEAVAESAPLQCFERSAAHELWQCDFKGPLEVDRRRVHPLTVLDDHSRYLLALKVCANVQMKTAWEVLWATFGEYGIPRELLSDGAFAASHGGLRTVSWIEGRLIRLGVNPIHGRAYHPQTQGKVERLHGTLEREVWPRVDRSDVGRFEREIDRWRREVYNAIRPHKSLDGRPPSSRFSPSPRSRPSRLPEVSYESGSELRRVASGGDISWNGYRILVGAGITREWVRVEEASDALRVYYSWKRVREIPHSELVKNRSL